MAKTVTWLHISDLHTSNRTGWDAERVLRKLKADLCYMEQEHRLHPDLIFFTGDAAFGQMPGESLSDQYKGVHNFFESVRKSFDPIIPQSSVFIVPGNHDVNRDAVNSGDHLLLDSQRSMDFVNSQIQNLKTEWKSIMNRLADYRSFLDVNGYAHLLQDKDRLTYSVDRSIYEDVVVRVVGLNSAWSCYHDDEKGHLWLAGRWQIAHASQQRPNALISVLLMHHPMNWFVQYEDRQGLRNEIRSDFSFHLHGHEHEGWVEQSNNHTRIAAGACYETSESSQNGYNFVRLDLETQKGKVWLRQYDSVGGGWVPRVIHGKTNDSGVFLLETLKLTNAAPVISEASTRMTRTTSNQQFDVKTTIIKTLIAEKFTEILKLRKIRARQDIRQLIIEPQPKIEPDKGKPAKPAGISSFYALPGRASKNPEDGGAFQVDFAKDEVLLADEDHAVLLGYTMDESVETLFEPAGIVAQQPVGTDALFIEVYFPPRWKFQMEPNEEDPKSIPNYRLYSVDPKTEEETVLASFDKEPLPNVTIKWLADDFGSGPINYFRVKILNPTQEGKINFDWKWRRPANPSA